MCTCTLRVIHRALTDKLGSQFSAVRRAAPCRLTIAALHRILQVFRQFRRRDSHRVQCSAALGLCDEICHCSDRSAPKTWTASIPRRRDSISPMYVSHSVGTGRHGDALARIIAPPQWSLPISQTAKTRPAAYLRIRVADAAA